MSDQTNSEKPRSTLLDLQKPVAVQTSTSRFEEYREHIRRQLAALDEARNVLWEAWLGGESSDGGSNGNGHRTTDKGGA